MKVLKQLFIMMFMVVGLSLTAMAQKDKPQDRPPKPPAPKVDPGKQPRPKDDKPKKPNMSFFVMAKSEDITTAE